MASLTAQQKRVRRHKRVRAKVKGTLERPRLVVFRSNQHIYCQLIDDESGKVLASASDLKEKAGGRKPQEIARTVGKRLAEQAAVKGIKQAVFDRAGYAYHGRVSQVAEGAREGGLQI